MFRRKREDPGEEVLLPVPAVLPPVEGLEEERELEARRWPRVWLWTFVTALAVVALLVYILVLGGLGIYDGLKDRTLENQRIAEEHYALGVAHLEAGAYELAIGEFKLALRHDANLSEARSYLREAEELARAQATPTSETRRDAAELLYRQAVAHYESGNLEQAVVVLDELRDIDADYQRDIVDTMLVTAHYQLGLNAVMQDRMDEAAGHFEAVLGLDPEYEDAQDQLNLVNLYTAAMSNWERDWSAAIQGFKGLFALAPDYKDVQIRLHDAYAFRAEEYADDGDWCRAADEYAAAVEVLPRESTVDLRDDARIQCQATAQAPTPTPTSRPRPTGSAGATPAAETPVAPQATPTSTMPGGTASGGRIAFTSYDAVRQRYNVYVVDLEQGAARLLRENASQPAFSPGFSRLAFQNHDPVHLGLGIIGVRSGEFHELTDHVEDSVPAWSPDAEQMVFASNKHGDRKWRVYVISPAVQRGEGEEWVFGQMPAWSPLGDRIAYHGCDERGDNCGLWLMQPGGFAPTRLTTHPSDTAPAWSPDGSQIAFISTRAGNWEVYLADAASGQVTRLTDHAAADVAPTWSPNGQQLAFLSNRGGGWAVHILDVKSGQVKQVIATGDAYPDPASERLSWVP